MGNERPKLAGTDQSTASQINNGMPPKVDRKQKPHLPLGDPPAYLKLSEILAWHRFKEEMPWLVSSDTSIVAMACRLQSEFQAGLLLPAGYMMLTRLIVQLRGTSLSIDRMPRGRSLKSESETNNDFEKEMFG
jgi:hypothetical protein